MRVVFFGTPKFAVPSLEALHSAGEVEVVAVVTQPDRPRGRSHSTLQPTPVKQSALSAGIPVMQPERPRGDVFLTTVRELNPDLIVVVAYGHILPQGLLELPRLGCVNVHASLLPRWRGAAPVQWALISGDTLTGISIMRMERGLDTGPVWLRQSVPVDATATSGQLLDQLASLGSRALLEALPIITAGERPIPQDESAATVAPKIDRAVARIRWGEPAAAVSRRIRAMDPSPGAWTTFGEQEIKVYQPTDVVTVPAGPIRPPGTITIDGGQLRIRCADADLALGEVQPAGKRRMSAVEWLRGSGHPDGGVVA